MSAPAEALAGGSLSPREAGLWATAGLLVLMVHGMAVMGFESAVDLVPEPEALEQALEVELSPIPVTLPQSVGADAADEVTADDSAEPEPVPTTPKRAEPAPAMEASPVETATAVAAVDPSAADRVEPQAARPVEQARSVEPVTETAPLEQVAAAALTPERPPARALPVLPVEPELVEEMVVEVPDADVVIPVPTARPVRPVEVDAPVVQARAEEPKPRPVPPQQRRQEKPEPKRQAKTARAERTEAPKKPAAAKAAPKADTGAKSASKSAASSQAARAAKAPTVNPARWHSAVRAAVARRVGRMRGMRGTVNVAFVVNAGGSVVSARVASSSGDPRLDTAALSAVRSARVPAPPPELGASSYPFAIPLTFR
jgi:protein TonB